MDLLQEQLSLKDYLIAKATTKTQYIFKLKDYLKRLKRDYQIYLGIRDLRNRVDPILEWKDE